MFEREGGERGAGCDRESSRGAGRRMAEEDAGPPAGIAGGGRDLALLSPNALRDGFLEQQREIRDAEDRVMRLQCVYNEVDWRIGGRNARAPVMG